MNTETAGPKRGKSRTKAKRTKAPEVTAEPLTDRAPAAEVAHPTVTPSLPAKPDERAKPTPASADATGARPDFDLLSRNTARLLEEGSRVFAAYMKPPDPARVGVSFAEQAADAVKVMSEVAERWLSDPAKAVEAQTALSTKFLSLWSATLRRFNGEEEVAPVVPPDPSDKRFADPEWQRVPMFDFLRQAHALTSDWANHLVDNVEGLDPLTKQKAQFYLRQIAAAVSPSNFVATNPELLRETFSENGENLVRGLHMLAEDLEAGKGRLKIRQSDSSKFELGVNMAATPGQVVFRNDLIELIQYAPTTETVYHRPLLIVPPWINKFYILDLSSQKSLVRWLVGEGFTVFMVSWVNPDARLAAKTFEDYMREGVLAAVAAVQKATSETKIAAVGYCVGGTLLATTLARLAQSGEHAIESVTFLTTLVDFTDPGELKFFVDPARLASIEARTAESGYLEGADMANTFNMLRPKELIWNYVVDNYLKGKEPPAFDLLTWNSDSTRMPAANLSFYLRNYYLENRLVNCRLVIDGTKVDLGDIDIPSFFVATREDHIAPAPSVFSGAQFFRGEITFVLAGSGHIAGIVNPPARPKYQYWTGAKPSGDLEDWIASATEHAGSWWPYWAEWLRHQSSARVPARQPGGGVLPPLCDAPGTYVRVKS